MSSKPLNDKRQGETTDATDLKPNPADFPLGSPQSRAAARIMQQEIKRREQDQERRGDESAHCAAWTISHQRGPMYWLRRCTKTENYQWKDQGLQPVWA